MQKTPTQIREANLLYLLRKYDPAGVGVFPEYEDTHIEYAHEASLLATVSDDNLANAICRTLQQTYSRVIDAYMTATSRAVVNELQNFPK